MGIADYGCANLKCTATDPYNAIEFESWANFTKLNIGSSSGGSCSPGCMTIQQNTVVQGVYDMGGSANASSPTGEYWIQNVPFISQSGKSYTISVEDNIWNFTTPTAIVKGEMHGNLLKDCSTSGKFSGNVGYYCVAEQSFTTTLPFEVNMTVITGSFGSAKKGGLSEVEFLVAIYHNNKLLSGGSFAYDMVSFNGKGATWPNFHVGGTTPQVSGEYYFYDAAADLVGPGDGSSVAFMKIAATLSEYYAPTTVGVFNIIPHAYSVGYDTAETSSGVKMTGGATTHIATASSGSDNFAFLF